MVFCPCFSLWVFRSSIEKAHVAYQPSVRCSILMPYSPDPCRHRDITTSAVIIGQV